MNIIIPVEDLSEDKSKLAKGFHNSDSACIYNSLNQSYEWLPIKDICESEENLSLALKHKGVYTVITSHMPYLALRLFKESGLIVYKSKSKSVESNIELFLNNELEPFTPQIRFSNSSCSSSCNASSCGPDCN